MKSFWQIAIVAMLMLTACSFGTKAAENKDGEKEKVEDNAGYAHAYGLYGNVKEVRISICKMTDLADGEEPWVESDKLEMAFDRQGHRLGRGKGYYDRFLSRVPNIYKIGVCFPFQLVDSVPFEDTDILMDEVVAS